MFRQVLSATLGGLWQTVEPRFGTLLAQVCNSHARQPAAFCRRLLCVSRTPWACCSQLLEDFRKSAPVLENQHHRRRERRFPTRPGTGDTESTPATGKVAAELCDVTRTSMPAELLGPAASNHSFLTHAARTRPVWRAVLEEGRLNAAKSG